MPCSRKHKYKGNVTEKLYLKLRRNKVTMLKFILCIFAGSLVVVLSQLNSMITRYTVAFKTLQEDLQIQYRNMSDKCRHISVLDFESYFEMGDGMWSLIDIAKCKQDLEMEAILMEIQRSRINRTHDGISAKLDIKLLIDDSFGILIEICKFVDGGCKQYQIISDDSIINLVDKYAKNNVIRAFEMAKIDPPEFPVNEGNYEIVDFIMDYCELPTNCVFGKFEAEVFLVNCDGEKVACIKVVIEFNAPEDDEELCE